MPSPPSPLLDIISDKNIHSSSTVLKIGSPLSLNIPPGSNSSLTLFNPDKVSIDSGHTIKHTHNVHRHRNNHRHHNHHHHYHIINNYDAGESTDDPDYMAIPKLLMLDSDGMIQEVPDKPRSPLSPLPPPITLSASKTNLVSLQSNYRSIPNLLEIALENCDTVALNNALNININSSLDNLNNGNGEDDMVDVLINNKHDELLLLAAAGTMPPRSPTNLEFIAINNQLKLDAESKDLCNFYADEKIHNKYASVSASARKSSECSIMNNSKIVKNLKTNLNIINNNNVKKNTQRYKMLLEGDVQVCKLPYSRNVISKILNSKLLRRWKTHRLILTDTDIYSTTVRICNM